jgi:uncharacterized tellurite resistance protein B-like protein
MAEWRKLAKHALLADGRIDTREVQILRQALFADNRIDRSELEFLKELHNEANSYVRAFIDLFIDGVKSYMLADGVISATETNWLRKAILADGKVDEDEKRLLRELKESARSTSPEFDALFAEFVGS